MKKIFVIIILLTLVTSFSFSEDYDILGHKVTVVVDGEEMDTYDYEQDINLPAFTYNSRTMLPLKKTFALFGIGDDQIKWNGDEMSVTVTTNDGDVIWMQIENLEVKFNNLVLVTDVPAKLFNNRTFVPVAFISKLLGEFPTWDDETRTVTMNPSTYVLNDFNILYEFSRKLGYTQPAYDKDENGYVFINRGKNELEDNKLFLIKYSELNYLEVMDSYQKTNYLGSEDFIVLSDSAYYTVIDEENYHTIIKFSSFTISITSDAVDIDVLKKMVESMKEVK